MVTRRVVRRFIDPGDTWRADAACKDAPPGLFFPDSNRRSAIRPAVEQYCRDCPVQLPCLRTALNNNEYGVWGGLSADQRTALRRARQRVIA